MTKKVKFNKTEVDKLPNNKSVLYRIQTDTGSLNYLGVARRGAVVDTILAHLDKIPGTALVIEQFDDIDEARKKEQNVVKRNPPKYPS